VSKGKIVREGEEIDESAFSDAEAFKKYLDQKLIIEKKDDETSDTVADDKTESAAVASAKEKLASAEAAEKEAQAVCSSAVASAESALKVFLVVAKENTALENAYTEFGLAEKALTEASEEDKAAATARYAKAKNAVVKLEKADVKRQEAKAALDAAQSAADEAKIALNKASEEVKTASDNLKALQE
jgi:hypothetical protein